ncbi:MAG TPA: DUF3276 family protein [Phnomibacter sp.]|nr:DUF3276 family protein [Phnomibacter sp.]
MGYDLNDKKQESVYSKRIRAGKRRTYFFDVKATRANDFYLTITESRKRFNEDGYDRHKIYLYKEDFNKFIKGLQEAVDCVKTDLMPNFDFDAFDHEYSADMGDADGDEQAIIPARHSAEQTEEKQANGAERQPIQAQPVASNGQNHLNEAVDKW